MRTSHYSQAADTERGAAVVAVLLVVGVLGTLSFGMLSMVGSSFKVNRQVKDDAGARFIAEGGLNESLYRLRMGEDGGMGANQQRQTMGGGGFWVESDDTLGAGLLKLTSTGVQGRCAARVELVVQRDSDAFFVWGAFGEDSLLMASNAHVDSYDSSLGTYASQAVNGSGSDTYANANGNVGSNADIDMSQNSTVNGNAVPGPGGTATLVGNAEVSGSTLPSTEEQEMPDIEVPPIASSGPLSIAQNTTTTIAAGDHAYDAFVVEHGATLNLIGPSTFVFDSLEIESNAEIVIDATNGPVEIFVLNDFLMNSNTLISSTRQWPADVTINLLSDNVIEPDIEIDLDEVDFDSNAQVYGTIYAPDASVEINSNFELFGALVARAVSLDSWSRVHFDEALLDSGGDSGLASFTRVSWRQVPVALSEIHW